MGLKSNVLVGAASITIAGSDVGYTTDGVTFSIKTDVFDGKVEEVNGTIIRKITDAEIEVTMTLAEGTLANMARAIPGSTLVSNTLTLGGGTLQNTNLILVGKNPAGFNRTITLTAVNPVGEVGIPYKKGGISVLPLTLSAIVSDAGVFGTITDSTS